MLLLVMLLLMLKELLLLLELKGLDGGRNARAEGEHGEGHGRR